MAIPAQRFKFLDNETNVAISDFLKVADNSIYTSIRAGADIVGAEITSLLNNPAINDLKNSINSALAATKSQLEGFANMVTTSLKDVVSSLKLPIAAVKAALKSLSQFKDKLTGLVQSAINFGKKVLCPLTGIADFLFGLTKYASITKAMIGGMLFKAMDSINKKLCSSADKKPSNLLKIPSLNEVATKLSSLGKTVLSDAGLGLNWNSSVIPKEAMSAANVIKYTKIARDAAALKASVPTPTSDDFASDFSNMVSDFGTSVSNISNTILGGNITSATKKYLVNTINEKMAGLSTTDVNYRILNELKVNALNAPMINPLVCKANLESANVGDKLTLSYKELMNNSALDGIDVGTLTNPSDIASITYLQSVKAEALTNSQLMRSEKSLYEPLTVAPVAGMDTVFSTAVITDNDSYKPNDVPATTTAYITYSDSTITPVKLYKDMTPAEKAAFAEDMNSENPRTFAQIQADLDNSKPFKPYDQMTEAEKTAFLTSDPTVTYHSTGINYTDDSDNYKGSSSFNDSGSNNFDKYNGSADFKDGGSDSFDKYKGSTDNTKYNGSGVGWDTGSTDSGGAW